MKREKKKSKLRLFRQEKFYTCAVACLRMVLDFYDHEIDEASLAALCRTDFYGTSADDLVLAAKGLDFDAQKEYCNIADLHRHLENGLFPILFVNLFAIDGRDVVHAFVLETLTRGSIKVLDPWKGRRSIPIEQFKVAWEKTKNVAVTVQRS
jgi:ABC-type bacteriocin/lantibiotic exporter with double-glycine peptidase domain